MVVHPGNIVIIGLYPVHIPLFEGIELSVLRHYVINHFQICSHIVGGNGNFIPLHILCISKLKAF